MTRGSIILVERQESLDISSKLWGSEVPQLLDYFSEL